MPILDPSQLQNMTPEEAREYMRRLEAMQTEDPLMAMLGPVSRPTPFSVNAPPPSQGPTSLPTPFPFGGGELPGYSEQILSQAATSPDIAPVAQPAIDPEIPAEQPLPDIQAPGDLARQRATQKLDRLSTLRTITEGIGGLGTLQTKAQIMTGQKRKPFVAETLRRRESVAEEELATAGVATSAFTPAQQKNLMSERTRWLGSTFYKNSNDAIDAANKIVDLMKGGGAITQEMVSRFMLRATGEQRLSDRDVASIRMRAGIPGLQDRLKRLLKSKMTQAVKDEYMEIAGKLKIGIMANIRDRSQQEAKSFARVSGIAEEEVFKAYGSPHSPDEYVNMTDPDTGETRPVRPDQVEAGLQKGLVHAQ